VGATTIFEYEAHEMIGQPSTHIISPELREEETQILTRLQQDERIRYYETVRVAKDGRRVESAVRGLSEIPIKLIVEMTSLAVDQTAIDGELKGLKDPKQASGGH
jgi:PAS domain S-box-containing protein